MDSGYWKVVAEDEARGRLAFFTPDGKWRWKVLPMGSLNSDPTFVAMMMKIQMKWDTLVKEHGLNVFASKIIVDDVLLYGRTSEQLLAYFRTVLDFIKHHHATLKLKKVQMFSGQVQVFRYGRDSKWNTTRTVQNEAFAKLERPDTWGDLRMIIGIFKFYSQLCPYTSWI